MKTAATVTNQLAFDIVADGYRHPPSPGFDSRFSCYSTTIQMVPISSEPKIKRAERQMLHAQIGPSHSTTSPDSKSDNLPISTGRLDVISSKMFLRILSQPLPLPLVKVASVLSSRRGAIITREEFVTEIWGEFASGGPLSAEAMISQYVALLRAHGLQIATFRARGYGIGLP